MGSESRDGEEGRLYRDSERGKGDWDLVIGFATLQREASRRPFIDEEK